MRPYWSCFNLFEGVSYYQFLRNSTYRRYGIFIITLFLGLYTMQAWINYKSIQDSILQEKQQIVRIENEIAYMQKWYQEYLQSEYASYFLGHENGQLYANESLIYLEYRKPDVVKQTPSIQLVPTDEEEEINELVLWPEEARALFMQQKLPVLWSLVTGEPWETDNIVQ